jgi:hypothetical protein
MLQGQGQTQRACLRVLRRRRAGADVLTLARLVAHTDTPSRSQLESTRRALRGLLQQGLVTVARERTTYRFAEIV